MKGISKYGNFVVRNRQKLQPIQANQPATGSNSNVPKKQKTIKDHFEVFQDESAAAADESLPDVKPKPKSAESLCSEVSKNSTCHSINSGFRRTVLVIDEDEENKENDSGLEKSENLFGFQHSTSTSSLVESAVETRKDEIEAKDSFFDDSAYKSPQSSPSEVALVQRERNVLYTTSGYDMDVFKYQRYREQKNVGRPRTNYINKQAELNADMRAVLVDWFVDVCEEYGLSSATFFLAVSLVDRTLSIVDCPRVKLQLLGATAIFVAAKMEEVYPPQLNEIVFITEDSYTNTQVLRMEKVILRVINFELNVPLIDTFATFYTLFQPISAKADALLWYLVELSAQNYDCISFKPSQLAAAAFTLISESQSKPQANLLECWSEEMIQKTGIARDQLLDPIKVLARLHRSAETSNLKAIYMKYATTAKFEVSCALRMPAYLF
ncbi:cyclin-A2 [Ditylenchus destructor]|uniref:Cyclin-A2 n=1 Tax=Ditylenchus destructor TaxID=166010 RepID=A0AAD4MT35_9BILA|nr:cyclin-A2 [Ditylenchus destructor]